MNIKNVNFKIFIYFCKQLHIVNTGKCLFMYIHISIGEPELEPLKKYRESEQEPVNFLEGARAGKNS